MGLVSGGAQIFGHEIVILMRLRLVRMRIKRNFEPFTVSARVQVRMAVFFRTRIMRPAIEAVSESNLEMQDRHWYR